MSAQGADPLVVAAWSDVAGGYASGWTERFLPFVSDALAAFAPGPGPLWVAGCGPGLEARALAARWPERSVLASDPSAEMIALAEAEACPPTLRFELGTEPPAGPLGGIFSSFVLQLLPRRDSTLQAWAANLGPTGQIALVFWPRQDDSDAWGHLGRALQSASGEARPDWEEPLRGRLPRLGLRLLDARDLVHEIAYPSPVEAWRLLVEACSVQVFVRRCGPAAAARARALWLADHGLRETPRGFVHSPRARLWILGRAEALPPGS